MPVKPGTTTVQLDPKRLKRYDALRVEATTKLRESISRPDLLDKMMTVYEDYLGAM